MVFLPCLNEAKTIAQIIELIPRSISGVDTIHVLVIDDGSTDNSAAVAACAGAKVISNAGNMGVGYSFRRAVAEALAGKYDLMCNIDADGQFDPLDIPCLLAPIIRGEADFVSGTRFSNNGPIDNMSKVKHWGNRRMTQLVNSLASQRFTDVSCGFRAYSREALMRLNLQGKFTYTQEVFLGLAFQSVRIREVPIQVRYFPGRKSRVAGNIFQYAVKTSRIIFCTYRDYRPLQFFSGIAGVCISIGSMFLTFLFYWWLSHGAFTPHIWSGFTGAAFVFLGVIAFVLGLLADMLTRLRAGQEEVLYRLRKDTR
jgi:glycosyltransferase involved in cell wall biosynthesis